MSVENTAPRDDEDVLRLVKLAGVSEGDANFDACYDHYLPRVMADIELIAAFDRLKMKKSYESWEQESPDCAEMAKLIIDSLGGFKEPLGTKP